MLSSVLERPTLLGSVTPRLWTPPLRELTPATSMGFDQIRFARDMLGRPADPWQEWLLVHAGELLPDGRPRFRIVVVLVARQNGKTETLVILSAYWQFVQGVPMVLGTSTKLDYARESWLKVVKLARSNPDLAAEIPTRGGVRKANGEQELIVVPGGGDVDDPLASRYKIAASNDEGGRSLTIDRLILDELRQHHDYSAWDAAEPATSAVRDAQIWALSNAGDDKSVVLNDLRESALAFIEWANRVGPERVAELLAAAPGDYRLGLFEWSAPEGADPLDPVALAQANPAYGRRKDPEVLLLNAKRAVEKGGQALAGFKTEHMCIRVPTLGDPPPISEELWLSRHDPGSAPAGDVALCVDVAPDLQTASIAVYGPRADGLGHLEVIAVRSGLGAVTAMVQAVEALKPLHDPVAIGLIGAAPEVLLTPLAEVGIRVPADPKRPARGDVAVPRAGELAEAWEGFLAAVNAGELRHRDQPPLTAAVAAAKVKRAGQAQTLDRAASEGDGGPPSGPLNAALGARWTYETRAELINGDPVYDDFDPAVHVVDQLPIPPTWPRYLAVRFGYTEPFTCQWWAEDPDGRLVMYREIYMTGRLVEEHARTILTLSHGEPRPTAVVTDRDAEDFPALRRHLGMSPAAAQKSVSEGVQAFAARLKAGRLVLCRGALVEVDATLVAAGLPTCLAEELPGHAWAPGKEEPLEGNDAGCIAARWLVAHRDLRKRAGTRGWI